MPPYFLFIDSTPDPRPQGLVWAQNNNQDQPYTSAPQTDNKRTAPHRTKNTLVPTTTAWVGWEGSNKKPMAPKIKNQEDQEE